jgi:7-cyano-7-deazaguanine synthase in queuosine biosynthesis
MRLQYEQNEIIRLGSRLGVDYRLTVSCYQADAEGRACGICVMQATDAQALKCREYGRHALFK